MPATLQGAEFALADVQGVHASLNFRDSAILHPYCTLSVCHFSDCLHPRIKNPNASPEEVALALMRARKRANSVLGGHKN